MKPSTFAALVRNIALAIVSFAAAVWIAASWPAPANAQDGPAITPNTACGAAGVGRLIGRADPVARSASEAAGSYVAEDGYWHTPCPLVATPGTQCGAPGVGYSDVTRGMLARDNPNAAAGWRVNEAGKWVECNRPCPPVQPESFRTWHQGDAVCTTYNRYDSDGRSPARDRVLMHGELGRWEQWIGSMRGVLHERCDDGVRTRTLTTCAPATECDTKVTHLGRYSYDARPADRRVPNGTTVQLVAEDGSTWPATCVAGSWDVPSARPTVTSPTARPPKPVRCGYSVLTLVEDGRTYRVRYMGPSVAPGVVVPGLELGGERVAQLVCGDDGRLRQVPPEQPADPTARWRELMRR